MKWKPPIAFHWRGNHHLYHGAWIIAFGLFQWFMGIDNGSLSNAIPLWQLTIVLGVAMVIDDVVEHTLTGSTPLRAIYEKMIVPLLITR